MLDGPVGTAKSNHVRQPSTRNRAKPPMPDRDELENRFIKVLVCKNNFTGAFVYKHSYIVYGECDILGNASLSFFAWTNDYSYFDYDFFIGLISLKFICLDMCLDVFQCLVYCLHCIERTHPVVSMAFNWAMQDIKLRINDPFHIFDWKIVFLALFYVIHIDSKKMDSKTDTLLLLCLYFDIEFL